MARYTFNLSDDDRRELEKIKNENDLEFVNSLNQDFKDIVVTKPWGYEYLVFENEDIAIWMLHIARKRKTSMHSHPNKVTNLILLSGQLRCEGLNWGVDLEPLDSIRIDKKVFHSSKAYNQNSLYPPCENGSFLLEIESPVDKGDLVRLGDSYGRTGKSYEGKENYIKYTKEFLKVDLIKTNWSQKIFDLCFSAKSGENIVDNILLMGDDTIVISIERFDYGKLVRPGEILDRDFFRNADKRINGHKFLVIEKEKNSVRLSDYVASFFASLGVKHIFSVSGGGAMHLVDSFGINPDIKYIATHHEQSAAMAAESYSRITKNIGAALFTTGPGGTNAITGLAGAWIDSIPVLYISGQVTSNTLIESTGLRQFGIQESNIVELVKPITKYAVVVKDPSRIKFELEKAAYIAKSGRPGPVWIDIPLDIQSKQITPNELIGFTTLEEQKTLSSYLDTKIQSLIKLLSTSKRPVIVSGYGIRLSHAEKEIKSLTDFLNIPVISSWTSSDLFSDDDGYYIGRSGIFGDRASNFTIQNADLLIIIGSRMSVPQTGYNFDTFSRESKKIMIDIDENEIKKPSLKIDLPIISDAKIFIETLLKYKKSIHINEDVSTWREICVNWKQKYPIVLPKYKNEKKVNSFYFISQLSKYLNQDAIVVTDMGTSFTCTMQTFSIKKGQRLTTSSGHASMGFGLPGAIGACYANNKKKVICISGEGGLQMNIQELQTVVHNKLPIILFVINNGGYLTIKTMQQNHFGRYVGSEVSSGVSCPDIIEIAKGYGINSIRINNPSELDKNLKNILNYDEPFICEIMMDENQQLIPRSSSFKRPDGSITSKPLEDLYPFLDRKEFKENMFIKPLEDL